MPDPETRAVRYPTNLADSNRLAREAEMIAEARAELQAGLFVDEAEVDAWIDSIGTDHELPVPRAHR